MQRWARFSCIKPVKSSLSTLPTGEVTYIEALYFCFMTAIRSPPKDVKNCFPRSYKNISGQEMFLASQGPSLVAVMLLYITCYGIWIVARPRELGEPYGCLIVSKTMSQYSGENHKQVEVERVLFFRYETNP